MGWLYSQQSKADLISDCIRTHENGNGKWVCLKHACVGNHLWTAWEHTREEVSVRYIVLFLLEKADGMWGYKDVEESMGPCEHDCPLSLLALVPEPKRPEGYHDWRQAVRNYHERRNQKLAVGQAVRLTNGEVFTITSLKPLLARDKHYRQWRIPRKMLTLPS